MSDRGWIVLTDGVTAINCWRWSVIEHYTLRRWFDFVRQSFPNVKGYAVGTKLFTMPNDGELAEWSDRRLNQELDSFRDALARFAGRELNVFVKDHEDLRREKYAAQQAAKGKKGGGAAAKAPSSSNNNNNNTPKEKKEKKKQEGGGGKKGGGAKAQPGHIDVRVGKVLSAAPHPDGDTLYVEQIDVGEEQPRTIVSGIREHVPLVQFVGARVLVMCNLKEKPLRGVASNGMIMCASRPTAEGGKTVRLLEVPEVPPGTRVQWGGAEVEADAAPVSNSKLGKLLKEFRTTDDGQVVWGAEQLPCTVDGKPVLCKELPASTVG